MGSFACEEEVFVLDAFMHREPVKLNENRAFGFGLVWRQVR